MSQKKTFRRKKTKNLYLSQFPSIYEGEYEQAMKDYEGYNVEALRKSFQAAKGLYEQYPDIGTKARIEAIVKLGKDR